MNVTPKDGGKVHVASQSVAYPWPRCRPGEARVAGNRWPWVWTKAPVTCRRCV